MLTSGLASSNDDKKFLRDISKTNPVDDKQRIQTVKGPLLHESFRWVLDHENFNNWRTEDSGIFWIKGDPGKGKTMLLCGIIDELESDPNIRFRLSYFFCQATDSRINTATAVIGGLVLLLLRRHQTLLSHIRAEFEYRFNDGPNAWIVLCEIFEMIIEDPSFENSIFIVDALDECLKDCSALLRFIIKTGDRVKWLLSSRHEKEIERELRSMAPSQVLDLEYNAECISKSINIYIHSRIQEVTAFEEDKELQDKALTILKDKANGTFLWVALVMEQLSIIDHWEVEDVLEEIPAGLESLYGLIIDKANNRLLKRVQGQEACRILLSIITTAERPLHLNELYTFMSFQWDRFKSTYSLQDIRSITKDCGSIFSIRDDVVYFIHQTAKDYIIKEKFSSGLYNQHFKMFQTAIKAISRDLKYDIYDLKNPAININKIHPQRFTVMAPITYCCLFWGQHLLYSYEFGEDKQKLEANTILYSFLTKTFLYWVESLALLGCIPQGLVTLEKLQYLVEGYCQNGGNESFNSQAKIQEQQVQERRAQELRQFVSDAYQFLLRSKETVENWPLQLYFSAIGFEANSTIRRTFEQTVRAHWGSSPTVASQSQNQSPILLQTVTLEFSKKDITKSSGSQFCRALFFPPDSSLIYSLRYGVLAINKVDTGELEAKMYVGNPDHVAFVPDTNQVIMFDSSNVKTWSMEEKSCVQVWSPTLRNNTTINYIIALSPKGDLIASFHSNKVGLDEMSKVKIWKRRTVVCNCLWGRSERPRGVFSPDSQLLALTDRDGVKIHCSESGNLVKYLDSRWHSKRVRWQRSKLRRNPVFSPDSRYLVLMESEGHLCLWNTQTWQLLHRIRETLRHSEVNYVTISPDSAFLGICGADGVKLWNIETGECIVKVAGVSHLMEFLPSCTNFLLVASHPKPGVIQIRRVDISHSIPSAEEPNYAFVDVVISPDSRFVAATQPQNNEISIWSEETGQTVHILKGDFGKRYCCLPAFSPNSELLASGRNDVIIWRVATGEIVCILKTPRKKNSIPVSRIAFSNDSNYVVAGSDHIYIWRVDTGQCMYGGKDLNIMHNSSSLLSVAISPDLTRVASLCGVPGSRWWSMRILKWRTGQSITEDNECWMYERSKIAFDFSSGKIAFSSNSAVLILISRERVHLVEVARGSFLREFLLPGNGYLPIFDPVNDLLSTSHSIICKMAENSWEKIKVSRAGYSYIYGKAHDDYDDYDDYGLYDEDEYDKFDKSKIAWILQHGEKMFYLPMDFRPRVNNRKGQNLDISDSLFAFVNESRGLVIIKLPIKSGLQEQIAKILSRRIGA